MVAIDPITRQRFTYAKHSGDIVLDASPPGDDDALKNEDVVVIGDWEDYTGSASVNSKSQQMWGAVENELHGTEAQIEGGANLDSLSNVGTRAKTHRRRRRKIYHRLDGK